jgi:redox-sensitive bicupin YhaK (pirin superfamily)
MMIPLQEWVLAHIHDNMEIITIPLEGDLAQRQHGKYRNHPKWRCAGHECWNRVKHSEFNPNKDQRTKLLQIWVFQTKNVEPLPTNYLDPEERNNKLQQILSPNAEMREFGFIKTPGFI